MALCTRPSDAGATRSLLRTHHRSNTADHRHNPRGPAPPPPPPPPSHDAAPQSHGSCTMSVSGGRAEVIGIKTTEFQHHLGLCSRSSPCSAAAPPLTSSPAAAPPPPNHRVTGNGPPAPEPKTKRIVAPHDHTNHLQRRPLYSNGWMGGPTYRSAATGFEPAPSGLAPRAPHPREPLLVPPADALSPTTCTAQIRTHTCMSLPLPLPLPHLLLLSPRPPPHPSHACAPLPVPPGPLLHDRGRAAGAGRGPGVGPVLSHRLDLQSQRGPAPAPAQGLTPLPHRPAAGAPSRGASFTGPEVRGPLW